MKKSWCNAQPKNLSFDFLSMVGKRECRNKLTFPFFQLFIYPRVVLSTMASEH